jgi:mannose-6-phosphate isomerase-like protein (cupin superfamily)
MRKFITGTTPDGRSCIVEESAITPGAVPGIDTLTMASLWTTDQSPPPARPEQTGHFIDTRLPAGQLRWNVLDHAPYDEHGASETVSEMHHSDTLDLILVLQGSTRMILQADERDLGPGDCVVMTGVDHAFITGPDGCRMVAVGIGTPPPG